MNKKLIVLLIALLAISPLCADFIRQNDQWYSVDKQTGALKKLFNRAESTDPRYKERHNPYQQKSDYSSFGSDPTFVDWTSNNIGNNR